MNAMEQAQRLWANLMQMGARKLGALAAVGIAVFALTGIAGFYLSRPAMETLYAGLDRQDVSSIGAALRDSDIPFDVSADGTTVSVRYGQTAQARMLLAEKGLPHSSNAGYELYDKMGSLGLTSFMQDVTRVRALEGELGRTIQSMSGIKAARVHIVLPDEGSFRRSKQPATASVLIRSSTVDDAHAAQAIRHLVAAAVPGMTADAVTVLSTDGTVLASGDDTASAAPGKMLDLEKEVSRTIQDNIRKTLMPSLGVSNLQISVTAKLNTDTKQVAETTYNPDGRVERSTRTVKESQTSQNSSANAPTTAGQNVPQNKPTGSDGKQSNEDNQKKEELTNYEVSSKTVTTVSAGYAIEHLSVAVVLNKSALLASLGQKAGGEVPAAKLAEIEQLAASAAGFEKTRGDTIKVMAVDFVDAGHDLEAVPSVGIMDAILRQSGTLINAGMVLLVTVVIVLFAVRPLTRVLSTSSSNDMLALPGGSGLGGDGIVLPEPGLPGIDASGAPILTGGDPSLGANPLAAMDFGGFAGTWQPGEGSLIDDVTSRPRRTPQKRLEQMIEFDEEQAAAILKQWIHRRAGRMIPIGDYLTEFKPAGRGRTAAHEEPLRFDMSELEAWSDEPAPDMIEADAGENADLAEQTVESPAEPSADLLDDLRRAHAADLIEARAQWAETEGAALAAALTTGLREFENRIADNLAAVLDPLIAKAACAKAVDGARAVMRTLLASADRSPITVRGPADLLAGLQAGYAGEPAIVFEAADDPELTITMNDTRVRSQLRTWARRLDAVLGAEP